MIKKYNFKDQAEADLFITNLGTETFVDEETKEEVTIATHSNTINKIGFSVVTEATFDEDGKELTPVVFNTDYAVDVIWNDPIPDTWNEKEVLMNGEASSFAGWNYETRKSRLVKALKKGIIIPNGEQSYWFDKESLNDFITMKNNLILLNAPAIKWKAIDREWHDIPMQEALQISVQGQIAYQRIYENN